MKQETGEKVPDWGTGAVLNDIREAQKGQMKMEGLKLGRQSRLYNFVQIPEQ